MLVVSYVVMPDGFCSPVVPVCFYAVAEFATEGEISPFVLQLVKLNPLHAAGFVVLVALGFDAIEF